MHRRAGPPRPPIPGGPRRRHAGGVLPWLLALVVLVGAAVGIWFWRAPAAGVAGAGGGPGGPGGGRFGNPNRTQPVSVAPVRRQDIRVTVSAIGSIAASNTAVVHAQVSGVLQSIRFKEGQRVKVGQTLAQIDARAFLAGLGQAEGVLARDRAQLDNARVDLARYQGLLAKDAVARQQVDTQAALVHQLEGTVQADQAAVDTARLQLAYTRVLAPISGRVGLKQADLGNVVQPGDANGIASITQTRPIALVFAVPSAQVPAISARLKAGAPLGVEAFDRDGRTRIATGRVATMDNAIDTATDTIKVKALFPNDDDALFPNQAVTVKLQLEVQHDALAVPQAALLRGAQGFYVYVVNADSTVNVRTVTPGAVDGDAVAVAGALHPGERVVIDGADRLREGAKVEVIAADPKLRAGAAPASGGAGFAALPPELAAKVAAMSPDERRAFFQARRAAASGASAPR